MLFYEIIFEKVFLCSSEEKTKFLCRIMNGEKSDKVLFATV